MAYTLVHLHMDLDNRILQATRHEPRMDVSYQATQPLNWIDGQGRSWNIEADPDTVVLTGGEERIELPQTRWREAISFAPSTTRVVIHFDTGQQEIGFMVPIDEAKTLFTAMKQPATLDAPKVAPEHAAQQSAPATPRPRNPLWPKMTAMPIVALSLASISFLPVAGFALGLAALLLASRIRHTTTNNAANAHIRTIAKLSTYVAFVGIIIATVSTYAMYNRPVETLPFNPEMVRDLEWSLGARIAMIVMVIMALSLHEAAHAITAWWCGDDYAKSLGRVTLNPASHIDPFGTIALPILLTFLALPVFAFARPVPVQLGSVPKYRKAHILISAAGPFSNILQAAACLAMLVLISALLALIPGVEVYHICDFEPLVVVKGSAGGQIIGAAALMLKLGFGINLLLTFFNMMPIPPLDGSWIAEHMLPGSMGRFYAVIRPYSMLLFLLLIWYGSGVLYFFLSPAFEIMGWSAQLIDAVSGFQSYMTFASM